MSNHLVFTKNFGTSKIIIVMIYINDLLIFWSDITEINIVKLFLTNQYKIKNLGSCGQFTRTKLVQNLERKTIFLS